MKNTSLAGGTTPLYNVCCNHPVLGPMQCPQCKEVGPDKFCGQFFTIKSAGKPLASVRSRACASEGEPIKIKVKSYQMTDSSFDLEFYNQDDADLFWNSQDKTIELVFNSQE